MSKNLRATIKLSIPNNCENLRHTKITTKLVSSSIGHDELKIFSSSEIWLSFFANVALVFFQIIMMGSEMMSNLWVHMFNAYFKKPEMPSYNEQVP